MGRIIKVSLCFFVCRSGFKIGAKCRRQDGPTQRGFVVPASQTYKPPTHVTHLQQDLLPPFSHGSFGLRCIEHLCMCNRVSVLGNASHVDYDPTFISKQVLRTSDEKLVITTGADKIEY